MKRRKPRTRPHTLIWVLCGGIVALGGALGVFVHRNLTGDQLEQFVDVLFEMADELDE